MKFSNFGQKNGAPIIFIAKYEIHIRIEYPKNVSMLNGAELIDADKTFMIIQVMSITNNTLFSLTLRIAARNIKMDKIIINDML